MRVLLVEDEPLIALTTEATLADAGHQVIGPYKTYQDALRGAEHEHPDIAVVDIDLAGRNEGIGIVRDLYDRFGIRSVFATGQPDLARQHRGPALGVLPKPYSPEALLMTLPVLERIVQGGTPPPPVIPSGLELFR